MTVHSPCRSGFSRDAVRPSRRSEHQLRHAVAVPCTAGILPAMAVAVLLTTSASAQDLTNHAAGKPYVVEPAPLERYADEGGGQLTDGIHGPPNYRASEWVGWRDTDYVAPIRVTIDLGRPTWIDRIVIGACGGGGDEIQPPERIDVAVLSSQFPVPTFVQIAQLTGEEPYEPGPGKVYRFESDEIGCLVSQVRLDFQERTWRYLFIDEIEILGGPAGQPAVLPVQDVLLEAEAGQAAGAEARSVDGASEKAVLLDDPNASLEFTVPLPAGDYTIRVRSLARTPDTFGELAPFLGGQPMRAQPVTNSVFTWQRSHFTQDENGAASITLRLAEGDGVYVDQIRLHQLTLNEPIVELRQFAADTVLVDDGSCRCLIAVDDAGDLSPQGESLAREVEQRSGCRPAIKRGDEVSDDDFREQHIIALGDRWSNFAILRASPNPWKHIPEAPEDGGRQVFVEVDAKGAERNVVVLGGKNAAQVEASVAVFVDRLVGDRTLTLPWTHIPEPRLATGRDKYRELAVESSKWLRQGAIRTLETRWKAHGDDVFRMLGYRYIEYKDSRDTIRQISRDGFIEAELYKIIARFDRAEHNGVLTGLERLQLTNTLLHMAEQCASIFDWELCGRSYHPTDEVTRIVTEREPTIANNHQTFPIYSLLTQGDYFLKYYHLPEADRWLEWADAAMRGQLLTSKPQCDCWGYQDITMIHTARYAATTGRWEYFDREPIHRFLTLRFISHDNLGSGVGYGDVGAYGPPAGADVLESNALNWTRASGGRIDLSRVRPDELLGVYVHPLEPLWYAFYGKDAAVPLDRCFDKISFRDAIDPDRAYLLLDGLSRGYHGHWDGNSILRFTDNGRVWLCEGDYLKGDPKDHNTMTFMRNGESGRPGIFSELVARFETPSWGATVTRTADYCGLDWDRHVLWHRPSDTFLLFDRMTAREAGAYDMKARFRSLGDTHLSDRVWTVTQAGGKQFKLHAPGRGRLTEAQDPEDAKNWKAYEFADPVPKLLHHRLAREMQPGDSATLPCIFYATDEGAGAQARSVPPNAMAIAGRLRALVGCGDLSMQGLTVSGTQFVIGPEDVVLVEGTEITAGKAVIKADAPISLALQLKAGIGVLEASQPTTLALTVGPNVELTVDGEQVRRAGGGPTKIEIAPGRHELRADLTLIAREVGRACGRAWDSAGETEVAPAAARQTHGIEQRFALDLPAEITALAAADLTGDDTPEILAGCEDGTLAALTSAGEELWRRRFDGQVNDLATADLDGDGRAEIACGVEDEHLHVLEPDGSELWKRHFEAYRAQGGIEGHVRVVLAEDFDGDGAPEIAVGCANSIFYVLDAAGQVKQSGGSPWEVITQHKASAIGAADVTGDGQLELLCGYTYFGRKIVDFAEAGRARVSNLGGCISGCGTITSADTDADGLPEAIFADKDGQVTACRKPKELGPRGAPVDIVWQKMIGDDAVAKVIAGDVDADGQPEIVLASYSGFVALLEADGAVSWIRYAENQVTDVALLPRGDDAALIVRSSTDGSLAAYDPSGEEVAWWQVGSPVSKLLASTAPNESLLIAATGRELRVAQISAEGAP